MRIINVDPLVKRMRGTALAEARKDERDRTIEECARVVEKYAIPSAYLIADAIRALKEKAHG